MATKEQTCAERIRDYYGRRMETIRALVKAQLTDDLDDLTDEELAEVVNERAPDREEWNADKINERASEHMDEMPLCVEVKRVVIITLGTGGPGDWFECQIDEDGALGDIAYHFNDWFDHAEINVTSDDAARAFCERFCEMIE